MRARMLAGRIVLAIFFVAIPPTLATSPSWAVDESCEVPEYPAHPAAGHWTGIFQCTQEYTRQDVPGLRGGNKYAGEMEFDLARYEAPDPPPEPETLRRPLGVPPTTPSAPKDNPSKNASEERCPVGPGARAKICGTAHMTIEGSNTFKTARSSGSSNLQTTEPIELEIESQESLLTGRFEDLKLMGTGKDPSMKGSAKSVAPGAYGSLSLEASEGTVRSHGIGVAGNLRMEGDSVHPSDKLFPRKKNILPLQVRETSCGVISGEVDAPQFQALMKERRFDGIVKESSWVATLTERDVEFENAVHALASEPVPADPSPAYVEAFQTAYLKLRARAGTLTDYKRCVLRALDRKGVQIQVAVLRIMVDNFPTVKEGATRADLEAAMRRVLTANRILALRGMDECPLALEAQNVYRRQLEKLLRKS